MRNLECRATDISISLRLRVFLVLLEMFLVTLFSYLSAAVREKQQCHLVELFVPLEIIHCLAAMFSTFCLVIEIFLSYSFSVPTSADKEGD